MEIDPATLEAIVEFLREMAGQIPYDQRTIKGGQSRQTHALALLDQLKKGVERP